jgi:hypothetical protein
MTTHELTVSIKTSDFEALNVALYGPEHGFGERTLALRMTSRSSRYYIALPNTCRYSDNQPSISTDRVIPLTWVVLCELAGDEPFLRVKLSHGASYHFVGISKPEKVPLEEEDGDRFYVAGIR